MIDLTNSKKILEEAIKGLNEPGVADNRKYILVSPTVGGPLNYEKYKGKGRPRKTDYDRIKNPIIDVVEKINKEQL